MENTFISGVGDEVVLFFLFIIVSFVLIAIFTLRDKPRESSNDREHHVMQDTKPTGIRNRRPSDPVTVRLIQPNSTKTVTLSRHTTIETIIRENYGDEVNRGRTVKLIHLGRILSGTTSLADVLADGSTAVPLHVHVQDGQGGYHGNSVGGTDLASYMTPLFVSIIGITWVAFLLWPAVFSLASKLMLFFLSIIFIVLIYFARYIM